MRDAFCHCVDHSEVSLVEHLNLFLFQEYNFYLFFSM